MAKRIKGDNAQFFVGSAGELRTLADWLDSFERAAVCRISSVYREPDFAVDLRELNKVLANGPECVGCLNRIDADKLLSFVGALQRDVAALLAGGIDAFLKNSGAQKKHYRKLNVTLESATQYLRWLGVQVREKLARDADAERLSETPQRLNNPRVSTMPKRKGRKKASYETVQKEAKLAAEWARAHDCHICKADFVKDKKITVKDLDKLLDRVAKRKRASD